MFYFVKTPLLLKKIYPEFCWHVDTPEKKIFLTFDDGPHAVVTPFVLETLQKFQAKATFFCIGKNVVSHPDVYSQILMEGHRVGNHTQNHLNGWKVDDEKYLKDVLEAEKYIDSNLFRPPYGRIKKFQASCLIKSKTAFKIIMWDVLSGDFDQKISPDQCARNVTGRLRNGSIVVFHDSEKAWDRMKISLPATLNFFSEKGYKFEALKENVFD